MKLLKTLAVLLALASSTNAWSASGSAYIPHYKASSGAHLTAIYLSNISDNAVTVEITLYQNGTGATVLLDGDGNASTGILKSSGQSSWEESPPSGASVKIGIAANQSIILTIDDTTSSLATGYGHIAWSQSDSNLVALIGHGLVITHASTDKRSEYTVTINNGLPF